VASTDELIKSTEEYISIARKAWENIYGSSYDKSDKIATGKIASALIMNSKKQ